MSAWPILVSEAQRSLDHLEATYGQFRDRAVRSLALVAALSAIFVVLTDDATGPAQVARQTAFVLLAILATFVVIIEWPRKVAFTIDVEEAAGLVKSGHLPNDADGAAEGLLELMFVAREASTPVVRELQGLYYCVLVLSVLCLAAWLLALV